MNWCSWTLLKNFLVFQNKPVSCFEFPNPFDPSAYSWLSNILLWNFKAQGPVQKSWQIQKVLEIFCRKSNYEAMLKNVFCNTSLEFLKATFRRWNLIFASEKNSKSAFVNTFCGDFSFRKPCPFEKVISIKGVFLHPLIDRGFDFTPRRNPTRLIWENNYIPPHVKETKDWNPVLAKKDSLHNFGSIWFLLTRKVLIAVAAFWPNAKKKLQPNAIAGRGKLHSA